jgi:hypothetical protein
MIYMIVRKNSFNLYTAADSVDDRLYMSEGEVLRRFEELQEQLKYPIAIAGE